MGKRTRSPGEKIVKDIKRPIRKHYSSEDKIRIVLDGLRDEDSIVELCRREGILQGIYYKWSKDFMEAGKKRLAGDTERAANTDEVKELQREAKDLKEVVAEQTLELRLLKISMTGPSRQIALQSPAGLWMGATTNEIPCI
jgi:transposase